jgi:hypothetical protein
LTRPESEKLGNVECDPERVADHVATCNGHRSDDLAVGLADESRHVR